MNRYSQLVAFIFPKLSNEQIEPISCFYLSQIKQWQKVTVVIKHTLAHFKIITELELAK